MDAKQTITVYHGTSSVNGNIACRTKKFKLSLENDEWLGPGIYFWALESDAWWWANRHTQKGYKAAVLETTLSFDPSRFCDLDDPAQMLAFSQEMEPILKMMGRDGKGAAEFSNSHELKNYCCTYYKRVHNMELMAYTFPIHQKYETVHTNVIGFEYTDGRKQYCATDNSIVKSIKMEVEDYAI